MTRTRSIAGLACVLAAAGLVAGCGGGSYTAAESGPSGSSPTTTTTAPAGATAASGADATSSVIGAVTPEDPSVPQATFAGYQRFPEDRAGKIFINPSPPPAPAAATTTTASSPATLPPTPVPGLPTTAPSTTTTTTPATTAPTTVMVATLDISGTSQTVKVGDQVPSDTKLFTVQSISTSAVTLKVNSGTLPGGGTTVDIAVGQSVTLSNPTTGASYTIKVLAVKQTTG